MYILLLYSTPQSLSHLIVQVVFSTRDRRPLLHSEEIRIETYARPPFQGDSLGDVFPGPNAFGPGLFCFRPSGDGGMSKLHLDATRPPVFETLNRNKPFPKRQRKHPAQPGDSYIRTHLNTQHFRSECCMFQSVTQIRLPC